MIPQIANGVSDQIQFVPYSSRTYRYTEDGISGYVDGVEAIKQSIFHRLSIERFTHSIYDDTYGAQFEQYMGKSFEFLSETIQETLKDALLQDDRITDVIVTSVRKDGINSAAISFTVSSTLGTLETEVSINV